MTQDERIAKRILFIDEGFTMTIDKTERALQNQEKVRRALLKIGETTIKAIGIETGLEGDVQYAIKGLRELGDIEPGEKVQAGKNNNWTSTYRLTRKYLRELSGEPVDIEAIAHGSWKRAVTA